jgi:hypothetical protein
VRMGPGAFGCVVDGGSLEAILWQSWECQTDHLSRTVVRESKDELGPFWTPRDLFVTYRRTRADGADGADGQVRCALQHCLLSRLWSTPRCAASRGDRPGTPLARGCPVGLLSSPPRREPTKRGHQFVDMGSWRTHSRPQSRRLPCWMPLLRPILLADCHRGNTLGIHGATNRGSAAPTPASIGVEGRQR